MVSSVRMISGIQMTNPVARIVQVAYNQFSIRMLGTVRLWYHDHWNIERFPPVTQRKE